MLRSIDGGWIGPIKVELIFELALNPSKQWARIFCSLRGSAEARMFATSRLKKIHRGPILGAINWNLRLENNNCIFNKKYIFIGVA